MRDQSREFLVKHLKGKPPMGRVLDVGSRNVSGEISDLFTEKTEYIGLDMIDGGNVDVVMNAHDLMDSFSEGTFDMVVCFDTIEHDDKFWVTISNCKKILKSGGYLVLGAPGANCPKHDHPNDYWRFSAEAFKSLLAGYLDVEVEEQTDNPKHSLVDEVYGFGRKP